MLVGTFLLVLPFIRQRQRLVKIREDSSTKLTGHVADIIGNAQAVKSFANEASEQKTHDRNVLDFITKAKRSWDYQIYAVDMVIAPLYVLTNVLGLTLVIYLGHRSGQLSTEAILVTFGYFSAATRALFDFNQIYRDLETSISESGQFTRYLLDEPAIQDPPQPKKLSDVSGDIVFENISFRYEEGQDPLFSDFSLHIPAGQKVGLVGRSGGGKTSITKLLLRFADVQKGSIQIDGVDIKDAAQVDLRSHMAYVPQEALMFHRTIADNIRYSKQNASMEDVIKATQKAHAHEFIEGLPQGYETLVGERGVKLSGGQRQRVAIARAILKDSPILLLDEATSALDSESEKLIQDALWKLIQNRTAIVIAHRLSTIQKMDRIIVLDKGAIIEDGSHEELLKQKGVYAELWSHQSGGFIEE
jgi:ATP-binding cassette subfamily B protein